MRHLRQRLSDSSSRWLSMDQAQVRVEQRCRSPCCRQPSALLLVHSVRHQCLSNHPHHLRCRAHPRHLPMQRLRCSPRLPASAVKLRHRLSLPRCLLLPCSWSTQTHLTRRSAHQHSVSQGTSCSGTWRLLFRPPWHASWS